MIITRNNYESFFLLYIDNELEATVRREVEAFVAVNPDLQMELDALQQTICSADTISFPGKENLLRKEVSAALEEKLLLLIDNELPLNEINPLQERIHTIPAIQQEFESLSIAKLDSSEIIPFPNKVILYKHSRPSVVYINFRRYAAAAIIIGILFGSVFLLRRNSDSSNKPLEVAIHPSVKQPAIPTPVIVPGNSTIQTNQSAGPSIAVNQVVSPKEISPPIKNTGIRKVAPVLVKSPVTPEKDQDINNNGSYKSVQLAVNNKSNNENAPFTPETITAINNKSKPLPIDLDLTKRNIPDASLVSFDQEKSEDKVLYIDEDRVSRSKFGILFKQVKRVVERYTKIKKLKGLHIGGFDISVK